MKEVLVLGIGNRFMMDDGIGVYVVEELGKRNTNNDIRYVVGETDIDYCLNQIEEASYLIIVDAACLGKEPGAISPIPLDQIFKNPMHKNAMQSLSVHDSRLLNEIKMRGKHVEGVFIGIEAHEVGYDPNLSAILQEQFIKIVADVESIIVSFVR